MGAHELPTPAALLIDAATVMRVETGWTRFGYPGIAISSCAVAWGRGLWLVVGSC